MKKRIKNLWVKALKSGEYKQGTDFLKNGNKYCCLGVLCDLYRKEHKIRSKFSSVSLLNTDYPINTMPNLEVSKWAGLDKIGYGEFGGVYDGLASFNDIELKPFSFIADYIKEKL